jgi:2-polyprenyl-3-methyl-5-hydroxy-6-metoxy-1,4-benzoquinol methylase
LFVALSTEQTLRRCQNRACRTYVNDRITEIPDEVMSDYVSAYEDFRREGANHLLGRVAANKPSRKLLDIGCGAGWLLSEANRRGWRCTGIDSSAYVVNQAKQNCPEAVIEVMDIHDMDFGGERFDLVCMTDVLEHVPEPVKVLHSVRRTLNDDGQLVFRVPETKGLIQSLSHAIGKLGWHAPLARLYRAHHIGFNRKAIDIAIRRSGFRPVLAWRENSTTSAVLGQKAWARKPAVQLIFKVLLFAQTLLSRQDELVMICEPIRGATASRSEGLLSV